MGVFTCAYIIINNVRRGMCGSCPVKSRGEHYRRRRANAWSDSFAEVIDDLVADWENCISSYNKYNQCGNMIIIIIVNENNRVDYENTDDKRYKRRVGRI